MKQKDILIIITLLFIFAVAWIVSGIYHSAVSSTISKNVRQDILPISPSFDLQAIEGLKKREKIAPSFDLGSVTPTPVVIPTQPSSPNASPGGILLL